MLAKKIRAFCSHNLRLNGMPMIISAAATSIAVIAILFITAILNNRFNVFINKSTTRNTAQIIDNVATNIDSYIGEMISVSNTISDLLNSDSVNNIFESSHFILRDDIDTIAVFDYQGNLIISTDSREIKENADIKQQGWFRSVAPGSKIYRLTQPHVQQLYKGEYRWVISLSRGIEWEDEQGVHQGIMLVDLNFNIIKELCSKELGENGYLYIVDSDNNIVYHPRQQMIYAGIKDNGFPLNLNIQDGEVILPQKQGKLLVNIKSLKSANWRLVAVSPLNGMFTYYNELRHYLLIVFILAAFLIVVLSISVSFLISRPLHRLIKLMGKVESGELSIFSTSRGVYEVNELSRSFNQMIYRIKKLMEQVIKEQQQLRKSELKALQAQINPHFLYNTLDSIVWMAESGDHENVIKMISVLAKFFRLSLSGGNDMITVEDELSHAETYLTIQKIRFNNQFDYEIDADEGLLNCKTLKIVLQPIIENAIIHGVGNLTYKGKIEITVRENNGNLQFTVKDNGLGIPRERLKDILNYKSGKKSGVGIRNVNQRIQLMCGSQYGLSFESITDEGTTVYINIPLIDE